MRTLEDKADTEAEKVWTATKKFLGEEITDKDTFERWIDPISIIDIDGDKIWMDVPADFYQTWLEENYLKDIKIALKKATGLEMEVDIGINPGLNPDPEPERTPPKQKETKIEKSKAIGRPLNQSFTFAELVKHPGNEAAYEAALEIAELRRNEPLLLYLCGEIGVGKTHIEQAAGHRRLETEGNKVAYLTAEEFANSYVDALQNRKLPELRKDWRTASLMLIDGVSFFGGKERMQEEFFHTINALYDMGSDIILTDNSPPGELKKMDKRLISRFGHGEIIEVRLPDEEARERILTKRAQLKHYNLPEAARKYIAQNVHGDTRQLVGALSDIMRYKWTSDQKIPESELEVALKYRLEERVIPGIPAIVAAVMDYSHLRLEEMKSDDRSYGISHPRQLAMKLCSEQGYSHDEIGKYLGKDRNTVRHGIKAHNNRRDTDNKTATMERAVLRELK